MLDNSKKLPSVVALGSCYVDINAEEYPFGSTGIPAETEMLGASYDTQAGGSAVNFCRLLGMLGTHTTFIGMAGTDHMGDLLSTLLQENNIVPALIRRSDLQTNVSFNMTSPKGDHIMCVAGTANAALAPHDVLPKIDEAIQQASTLYLGGCFKLQALHAAFPRIVAIAKDHAATIVVDHGRIPKQTTTTMLAAITDLVRGADYYLPSREEFCQLWDVRTPEKGLHMLHDQVPGLVVIVKDGANGALFWADNKLQHVPATPVVHLTNATGAGDSFNTGVMHALTQGHELPQAVAYGGQVAAAHMSGQAMPKLPRL